MRNAEFGMPNSECGTTNTPAAAGVFVDLAVSG
ncbi:hypothetical protein QFZ67_002957 [Streptomyces sp. V1I1]|nr:hypothetical protein [Streptomyces sp. V1I1]